MPTPAELVGRFVEFVGDVLGASSLRFGIGPTLVVLGVLLVFLQLVARPISRGSRFFQLAIFDESIFCTKFCRLRIATV